MQLNSICYDSQNTDGCGTQPAQAPSGQWCGLFYSRYNYIAVLANMYQDDPPRLTVSAPPGDSFWGAAAIVPMYSWRLL